MKGGSFKRITFFIAVFVTSFWIYRIKDRKQLSILKLKVMKGNLVTIVVLPYSKAHILKMRLEAKKIECDLETITLIEGVSLSAVRVKILEQDIEKAMPVLDDYLGVKPEIIQSKNEKERHILIPVNFTKNCIKSCKMAFSVASHLQIKMVFLHCYSNPIIHSIPYSDVYTFDSSLVTKLEYAEKTANERFQQFISKLVDEIGKDNWESVQSEYIIKSGYAENDILAYAQNHDTDLIVIGSGGDEALNQTIGSVTVDVMYNARVPVLVVPEKMPEQDLKDLSKVLYATNFDEKDFVALDKLMSILYPFDIELICAHVGHPKGDGWDLAKLNGMRDILKDKYRSDSFECKLIVGNDILTSLENFIEKEKIDILSLTTHKRNMISRLFNPSLARRMVFHTHTPLLVFHA